MNICIYIYIYIYIYFVHLLDAHTRKYVSLTGMHETSIFHTYIHTYKHTYMQITEPNLLLRNVHMCSYIYIYTCSQL